MTGRGRSGWHGLMLATLIVAATATLASAQSACAPTKADMEGPFYKAGAPVRTETGQGLVVAGAVRSAGACAPIAGARVEWWQANPGGVYDDAHRGALVSGEGGRYRFSTSFPPPYSGRPAHVHIKVFAPGHRTLTTQLYPRVGQTELTSDFVLTKE